MNNLKLNFIVGKHILNQNIGTRARFKSCYSKGGQWMSILQSNKTGNGEIMSLWHNHTILK